MAPPPRVRLITPSAASYVWRISDARMRKLALDGDLAFRMLRWNGKPCRAYDFDACVARWGRPDPHRITLLMTSESFQITGPTPVVYEILAPRPVVLDQENEQ